MANIGRAYGRIIPPENDDDGGGFIALAIERERERDRPADVHRGVYAWILREKRS